MTKKSKKNSAKPLVLKGFPENLSPAARAVWDILRAEMANLNFIRNTDEIAFARYCEHTARWWQLTQDILQNGETYVTDSDHGSMERLRPAFIVRERTEKLIVSIEDRFGLNPAFRQQILHRMTGLISVTRNESEEGELDLENQDADNSSTPESKTPSPIGLLNAPAGNA